MAKNRSQLRTDLRNELKTDPSGKIWKDAELNLLLDQAYSQIQNDCHYALPENEPAIYAINTIAGTQEYSLPTNFARMESVVRANNYPLTRITKRKLEQQFQGANSQGTPNYYYIRGSKIGFYPIPNGVETMNLLYEAQNAFVTDDSTAIDYEDNDIDRAIVKFAAYLAWSVIRGNRSTAIEKKEDYDVIIEVIQMRYLYRDQNIDYKTQRSEGNYYNPKVFNYWR